MILTGNVLSMLHLVFRESIDCCVTSPPYWGLRDYGTEGQLGLEKTPDEFVAKMVEVFRLVHHALKPTGTLWLNLGDSYARSGGTQGGGNRELLHMEGVQKRMTKIPDGSSLKPKDLVGIPWRVAFALQADGWYLRQDIIWHKPNPMPESVRDRCTKSHEYIFMFSKSPKYFYDIDAIKEPASHFKEAKWSGSKSIHSGKSTRRFAKSDKQRGHSRRHDGFNDRWDKMEREQQCSGMRNKRSVWTVAPHPFKGAHFATFPPKLIEPCILAGCPEGGTVLDPFFGAGTTGLVAKQLKRKYVGIELNPDYVKLARERIGV